MQCPLIKTIISPERLGIFSRAFQLMPHVSKIFFEVIYILQHLCIHKMLFCNATRNLLTNFHYSKSVPSMLQFPNIT